MSAKKNYFYSVVCEIITTLIPFITLPYLSRTLGAEGVGEYVYAFTWTYYFMLIGRLGIRMYGNRTIARLRDDPKQLSRAFSEIYTMQLCMCAFTLALYIAFCRIWFADNTLFLVLVIYMASTCFEIDWFYYGLEKIKRTAMRTISVNLLTAVSIFMFVRASEDIWIYAFISSAGAIAGQFSLFIGLKKYISWEKPSLRNVFQHIKPNLLLFAPTMATSIYRDMDKLMLGWLSNYTQLGLYENAIKLQTCLLTLITSLSAVMLPRISNLVARGEDDAAQKYLQISNRFVLFLSSAIAFGIGGIAVEFAPLYFGSAFAYSGWLMMWLTPTIIFVCFSGVIRSQYIIPYGKDRIYLYTVAAGAVVNFTLNYILIPRIGAFGSVIGTIFAELTVVVMQFFYLHKYIPYKKLLVPNLFFIACAAGMFGLTRAIAALRLTGYLTIAIQIICGGLFYLVGSLVYLKLTRDEVLIPPIRQLLTKGRSLLKKQYEKDRFGE